MDDSVEIPTDNNLAEAEMSDMPTHQAATPIVTEVPTAQITQTLDDWQLPALNINDPQERLVELLKTNGGCHFPCWWGIIPGETTWETAQTLFRKLSIKEIRDVSTDEIEQYIADFSIPEDVTFDGLFRLLIMVDETGTVQQIRTMRSWDLPSANYSISSILSKFGHPNQIWFRVTPNTEIGTSFRITLMYPDDSTSISYFGKTDNSFPSIEVCLADVQQSSPAIVLWSPKTSLTFDEVNQTVEGDRPFYPIEEVADVTVNDFYNTYKFEQNATECFNSPTALDFWPPED